MIESNCSKVPEKEFGERTFLIIRDTFVQKWYDSISNRNWLDHNDFVWLADYSVSELYVGIGGQFKP
jgi:hypothetical protein